MLGKLARWLRMMGQDVIYSVQFSDSELLKLAKAEERVLLTRDFELYKRAITRSLDTFYVEGKTESERLVEVGGHYNLMLEVDRDKSHCPICHTKQVACLQRAAFWHARKEHPHLLRRVLAVFQLRSNLLAGSPLETNYQYPN